MAWKLPLIAAILAGSTLAALPSRADPAGAAVVAPGPPAGDQRTRSHHWYGWQTLSLDSASLALILVGTEHVDSHRASGIVLSAAGFGSYALAAPAVHWAHDRPGPALLSLGTRVGLPLIVGGILSAGAASGCPAEAPEDTRYCERMTTTILVSGSLSMLAASIIDAAALAWEPALSPPSRPGRSASAPPLWLSPTVGFDRENGGRLGLVGTF